MDLKEFLNRCQKPGTIPESVSPNIKKFVLIHLYVEPGHYSIISFSNSVDQLLAISSASWFEKAKNSAYLGSEILENY